MARALLIGENERKAIAAAIERARQHPVRWEDMKDVAIADDRPVINLKDRKPNTVRPVSEHVPLPIGYRASFSFEYQPAGLFRHLSISVDVPGNLPNREAVEMIAKEFGFNMSGVGRTWIEEFSYGHHAVNVIELVMSAEAGHA